MGKGRVRMQSRRREALVVSGASGSEICMAGCTREERRAFVAVWEGGHEVIRLTLGGIEFGWAQVPGYLPLGT